MLDSNWLQVKRLNCGDILNLAFRAFKANTTSILTIMVLFSLPFDLVQMTVWEFKPTEQATGLPLLIYGIRFALLIVGFLLSVIMAMSIALIVERAFYGETIDAQTAIKAVLSKFKDGTETALYATLIIIGGLFLLIVPGVIWFIHYLFVLQIVILRNKTHKEALDASKSLVVGHWGSVFVVNFVLSLAIGIANSALIAPVSLLGIPLLTGLANALANCFFLSFYYIAITILFLNYDLLKNQDTPSPLPE